MRRDEHGTMTLWVLGLCVALLFLAGLALDFWRAIAVRREIGAMADAAATAGANGLDEGALRMGEMRLDESRARALAVDALEEHSGARKVDDVRIDVVDGVSVTVTLREDVEFALLGIFLPDEGFSVQVSASAEPRRVP